MIGGAELHHPISDTGPEPVLGGSLVAHLSGYFFIFRKLTKATRFPDIVGKRFLAVNGLAKLHGGAGRTALPGTGCSLTGNLCRTQIFWL